ncbi:MAG TPA: nucleotidyltransferase family protein [Gammaproteobacteria bacterium]|nr:nucleotidyltransferase family protein [Gammaproteobacteria bacterium]
MRGMILAAGRGARMGVLTEKTPKPLLKAGKKYLIEYSIDALVRANVRDIVINISWHADLIKQTLGDGSRYGARFYYSEEPEALETGGGIVKALPLLGDTPFIVLSSDIITDYSLNNLPKEPDGLAHLVLVNNPVFHPRGDFNLHDKTLDYSEQNSFTFANVGLYRPALFAGCEPQKFRLGDLLKKAVKKSEVTGEHYEGVWHNVGTPADLEQVHLGAS